MSDDLKILGVDGIRRSYDEHYDTMMDVEQDPTGAWQAIQKQAHRIEELEAENKKLHKALEIYERERTRFKHAKPEMTGEFFIAGCHGSKDNNLMPQFIEVCPAYGAGWVMIYENTGRTISYEGS